MTLWERALQLAKTHVALTVSLSLAILVVLRALYFAKFDLPVAFAVLALTNQATLLTTTLAWFVVAGLSIVWAFDPGGYLNRAHETGTPRAIVFGATIAVTAMLPVIYGSFMSPIFIALATLGLITLTVVRIRRGRRSKRRPESRRNHAEWAAGLVSGAIIIALLGQPWTPSEQITTTPSGDTVAGYIVGEQAGQLLLLDRSRQPVWIKVSNIASRKVCEINLLPPDLRWITTPMYHLGSTPTLMECADA